MFIGEGRLSKLRERGRGGVFWTGEGEGEGGLLWLGEGGLLWLGEGGEGWLALFFASILGEKSNFLGWKCDDGKSWEEDGCTVTS